MLNDTKDDIKKASTTSRQAPSQTVKNNKFSTQFNQQPISDALHLAALKKMITTIPDSNQERIHYLRSQIAAGTYQVNSHHIALQMHKAFSNN